MEDHSLRVEVDKYRILVESVLDYAIFLTDPDGRIASWNLGAERMKGYSAKEALGMSISAFYPEEDVAAGKPARLLKTALELGRVTDEGWRIRKDGVRFWALVTITALYDDDGRHIGFAKVTRDLTARRAAEREIVELSEKLRQRNADLSAFASTVSHDLKAPLRSMTALAELLLRTPGLPPDAVERATRIVEGGRRMHALIEGLLEYTRRTEALRLEPVDLDRAIDAAVDLIRPEVEATGAKIAVEGCGLKVLAHGATLDRILGNLLGNALKYRRPGEAPRVEIACSEERDRVRLEIRDHGVGVPEEAKDKIFEPFTRFARDLDAPGHGLGLAIARRAAAAMGGSVGHRPPPSGAGAIFWLELAKAE